MDIVDIMKRSEPYVMSYADTPSNLQLKAKKLCWQYNQTAPDDPESRTAILHELLGDCTPLTMIEPDFHCDYGFNIHFHGLAVINYNCVFLDTSPIEIGENAFIAPGVCLACADHPIDAAERSSGISTSSPITIGRDVWIGANATVCGSVTIGDKTVIGAGSVVTKSIPAGVVAVGNPCRVLRPITEADRLK